MQIQSLVEAQFNANSFSRAKLIKSVCDALEVGKEVVTRGVKAQVCNAVDDYAKKMLESVKMVSYVSARTKMVLTSGMDSIHIKEQAIRIGNTGREISISEQVTYLRNLAHEKRVAFLKEPGEGKWKSFMNLKRRLFMATFDLEQSCITEDCEQAKAAREMVQKWSDEIKAVGVVA